MTCCAFHPFFKKKVGLLTNEHSMLGLKSSKAMNLVDVDLSLKEEKEIKRQPEGIVGFTVGNKNKPQVWTFFSSFSAQV